MPDNLETSLKRLEVVTKTLDVVRNVYFHEKERKDQMIADCLSIVEKEISNLKN